MAGTESRSIKVLFREWRQGDAEAGQIMAQRFADWYYAIATSRLGEEAGRGPCETACAKFGEGVANVSESRALVSWAHKIIQGELADKGDRITDGDFANAYTGNKMPKTLLCRARAALPDDVALLEQCYRHGSNETIEPLPVLKARYKAKRWLRENANVPFEVVPEEPVLDRAPMPLYESGRMATPDEEVNFEQWMISDLDLCKDIAEFAHFAIALRGGLPSQAEFEADEAMRKAQRTGTPAPAARVETGEAAGGGMSSAAVGGGAAAIVLLGGGGVVLVGIIIAAIIFMM